MKFHICVLFVVLLAVQACNEKGEPEPEPTAFLTVTVAPSHSLRDDMWVFATDGTGKVLDAHPIKPGSFVSLKSLSTPEVFYLTVYYNNGGSPVSHLFYTYAGIARGAEITLEEAQNPSFLPSISGKATINIQNCIPYAYFNLSDGFSYSTFSNQSNTSLDAPLDLRQESSNILIAAHKAIDQPVYGWLDNVNNSEVRTMDFNNLTPFPKTISILFSESMSAFITGRKADGGSTGYIMANNGFSRSPEGPNLAKFGYLDGFDEYSLSASSTTTTSTYYRNIHYIKRGTTTLPEEVTFPATSLAIENSSIGNFSFTYSSTYTYRRHYWRQDVADFTMHWQVVTDQTTTPIITELPEAFTIKYPSLSVSNLTYSSSVFYKQEDEYTYADYLSDTFGSIIPGHREYFSDQFQQK